MSKLQKQAKELLQSAHKIYHYRRDLIPEGRLDELEKAVGEVDTFMRKKPCNDVDLEAAMGRLDGLLGKVGGKMYPKTFWNDNIEVLLVAAILVIGVRTFFFQPFIIPTNSMYPTYSGMNSVVYEAEADSPGAAKKILSKLTLGASHKSLIAEKSGNISLVLFKNPKTGSIEYNREASYWKFFVIPSTRAEYVFSIDGKLQSLEVPREFDMSSVLRHFFPNADLATLVASEQSPTGVALNLNQSVKAGDDVLRFDITLGDALFVDRISYHFKRPAAGDPFVFRTREIPGIEGG
ncbi:MAG: S26 family signal peptidase, partial [Opitutales bacterium]|nr:S26 family signal peptidase [Opitutales bacterium]